MSKQKNGSEIQTKDISVVGTVRGAMDYRQSIPIRSLLGSAKPIRAIFRGVGLFLFFGTLAFHAGCKGCEDKGKTSNVGGGGKQSDVQNKENKKADQDIKKLDRRSQ